MRKEHFQNDHAKNIQMPTYLSGRQRQTHSVLRVIELQVAWPTRLFTARVSKETMTFIMNMFTWFYMILS